LSRAVNTATEPLRRLTALVAGSRCRQYGPTKRTDATDRSWPGLQVRPHAGKLPVDARCLLARSLIADIWAAASARHTFVVS
jgi:hypothetical protein